MAIAISTKKMKDVEASVNTLKGGELGTVLNAVLKMTTEIPENGVAASIKTFLQSIEQSVKANPLGSARNAFQLGMGLSALTREQIFEGGNLIFKGIVARLKNGTEGKDDNYETKH